MLSSKMNGARFLSHRRLLLNHLSNISTSRLTYRKFNQNSGEDFHELERNLSFPARNYNRFEKRSKNSIDNSTPNENNAYKSSQNQFNNAEESTLHQACHDPSSIPKFIDHFDQWWFNFYNRLMNMSPGRVSYVVRSLGQVNKSSDGVLRKRMNRSLIRSLETQFVLAEDSSMKAWYLQNFLVGLGYLFIRNDFYAIGGYPSKQFVNKLVKFFKNGDDQSTEQEVQDIIFCDCIHKLSTFRVYPEAEDLNLIVEKMKLLMHSWQNCLEKIMRSVEKIDIANCDSSDTNVPDRCDGDYLSGAEIVSETICFLTVHNQIASTFINWGFDPDQCVSQAQQQVASFWRLWFKNAKQAFTISSTDKFRSIMHSVVDQSIDRHFWIVANGNINGLLLCLGANCGCVAEQYSRLPELFNVEHSIGQTCMQIFPQFRQKPYTPAYSEDNNQYSVPFYAALALEVAFRRCESKIRVQTLLTKSKKATNEKHPGVNDEVHLLKGDKVFLKLSLRLKRWDESLRTKQVAEVGNNMSDKRPDRIRNILSTSGNIEAFGPIFSIYYMKANNFISKMINQRRKKQENNVDETKIGPLLLDDEENLLDVAEPSLTQNVTPETEIDYSNFACDASNEISSQTNVHDTFRNLRSINERDLDHSPENESCDHAEVANTGVTESSEEFIEEQYFKSIDQSLGDKEESSLLRDEAKNVTDDIFDEFSKKFEKTRS